MDASNTLDGWASTIRRDNVHKGLSAEFQVPCFDFSKLLESLVGREIYVKMDIEGAEFDVLRHLLEERTLRLITELYVEFHERLLLTESKITREALWNACGNQTNIFTHG